MDSYCRTCLCPFREGMQVFNIFKTEQFSQKLMKCCNLHIDAKDGFPSSVCGKCYENVLGFYSFQEMCYDSLDKLKKMVLECEIKENNEMQILVSKSKTMDEQTLPNEETCHEDPLLDIADKKENSPLKQECNIITRSRNPLSTKNPEKKFNKIKKSLYKIKQNFMIKSSSDEEEESVSDIDMDLSDNSHKQKSSSEPLSFQCEICVKKFRFKHRLDAHIRRHQGQRGYPCTRENCERTFNRLSYLQQHLNDHDGIPRTLYKCDFENCKQSYTCMSGLRAHRRKSHSGKPFKPKVHMCETCGAVLTSSRSLRDHRFIHVDKSQWPFICDIDGCAKRFRILHQLKIHQKRHAGIKNYACPHCDMRFVTRTNMNNHINHHTWEKTWTCDFCPKVCNTPAVLRSHIQNKHGQRPSVDPDSEVKRTRRFQCSFCESAFLTADGKKYHELIHTGEKPHICEECGKKFRQPAGLKTHMRTHIKDAPRSFVCGVCGRAYFNSQTLKHHEMKHTGEKPYKCDECGLKFRWPNNLTRHQRLHQRNKESDSKQGAV